MQVRDIRSTTVIKAVLVAKNCNLSLFLLMSWSAVDHLTVILSKRCVHCRSLYVVRLWVISLSRLGTSLIGDLCDPRNLRFSRLAPINSESLGGGTLMNDLYHAKHRRQVGVH